MNRRSFFGFLAGAPLAVAVGKVFAGQFAAGGPVGGGMPMLMGESMVGEAIMPLIPSEIIARTSTDHGDPGERLFCQLRADGKKLRVWLNGIEEKDCITADPVAGYVVRAVRSPGGNLCLDSIQSDVLRETVHGHVITLAMTDEQFAAFDACGVVDCPAESI